MQYKCFTADRFKEVLLLAASLSDGEAKMIEIKRRSSAMTEDGTAMYGYKLPVSGKDIIQALNLAPGPVIKEYQEYLLNLAFQNPKLTRQKAFDTLIARIHEK